MYYKNYTHYNSRASGYAPKKAVKSFKDLEVYQKALEGSVFVAGEIINFLTASRRPHPEVAKAEVAKSLKKQKSQKGPAAIKGNVGSEMDYGALIEESIIKNMVWCALSVPHLIAESHSKRFGDSTECLKILDEVMLRCNKIVVYLEQTRDILNTGIETDRFNEEINKYFYVRRKVLNLQRVWRKYINQNQEAKSIN